MKKIAIISQIYLPIPDVKGGGIELLIRLLIEQNEIEKKYRLIVFSVYDKCAEKISHNYKYTDIVYIKVGGLSAIRDRVVNRVATLLGKERIPHRTYYNKIYNIIKSIDDLDAVVFEGGPAECIGKFRKLIRKNLFFHSHVKWLPTSTKNMYDKVLTVSDYLRQDWLTVYPENKIRIVKNGFDSNRFERSIDERVKNELRREFRINDDDFVVVYVGRIIPLKGVLNLINAWHYIKEYKIKLLVIGSLYNSIGVDADYSDEIKAQAKSDGRIILADYIDNMELYKYLQIADVQAIPTIGDEAAGIVAVEAMASGLPLIITDSGGLPEYSNVETSILIKRGQMMELELANAIKKIYNNKLYKEKAEGNVGSIIKEYSQKHYYEMFFEGIELDLDYALD